MTELKMTTEAEVEDFTDELSDEAIDRAEGDLYLPSCFMCASETGYAVEVEDFTDAPVADR